ncbi:MAG TPA: TRAP transporter small permease [Alphaproteobacteria bacterium]|nr:TRAP transporter small permease [Alphaproteobacteria bacterium]
MSSGDDSRHGSAPPSNSDDHLAEQIGEAARRHELEDLDAGLGPVDRAVNRVVEVLGVSVLVAIVVTIFCNAVGRYAFDAHLIWAEELVLMLMPWLAMTGTFLAVRRGTMIRIDFFYSRLPYALRRPVALAGYALCVVMLTFLGVISSRFVSLFGGDPSPYLDIATGWSTIALAVGGFAVAVAFLAVLMREFAAGIRK